MAADTGNVSASDEYIQHICDLCSQDNQRIEAKAFCTVCMQYLCEACHKAHTRANASKHHKCLTGNQMPGEHAKSQITPRCKQHPEQTLDHFCYDHRVIFCTTCKLLNHRNCKKMDSINDLASKASSKNEAKMKLTSLNSLLNEFVRLENSSEVQMTDLDLQKDDLIKNIRKIRKDIDQYLDKLEKDMVAKINKDMKTEVSLLSKRKHEINCIVNELKKNVEEFEDLQKRGSDNQVFVIATFAEENIQKYTSIMDEISGAFLPDATLHINDKLKDFKRQVQSFGDFEIKKTHKGFRRPFEDRVVVYLTEVDVSSSTDKETAKVNSVEVMPDGGLLMCDGGNGKIILFDFSYKSVSELSLSSNPYGMISVSPVDIIATLPEESCLQTVKIKNGQELKLSSRIRTRFDCYRLVKYEEDMVALAGDDDFTYLNLMDVNGRIIRCIRKESESDGLLRDLCDIYLSIDKLVVYVTDQKNGCIGFSLAGEVVFSYKENGMGEYPGVCSDPDGWVYITCSETDKVVMVNKSGEKKKDLIQYTGIKPNFMTYSAQENRLFLKRLGESKICVFTFV